MEFDVLFQEVREKSIRVECDEDFVDTLVDELCVEFDDDDVVHFSVDVFPVKEWS